MNIFGNPVMLGGSGGCNPAAENLLCNWEFSNAVNTRGQSSYSGSGVTWATDGWLVFQGTAAVATGGIKLARYGSASFALYQQKPAAGIVQAMLGKTLTVSAMVDDSFGCQTIEISSAAGNQGSVLTVSGIYFYMYRDSATQMTFNIYTDSANNDNKLIKAVKLEAGSESTLAHQEGGVWVLNENQNNDAQYIFVRGMVSNS